MELAIEKLKERTELTPEARQAVEQLHHEMLHSGDHITIKFLSHILNYNHLSHPAEERAEQKIRIRNKNWRARLNGLLGLHGFHLVARRLMKKDLVKEFGLTKPMSYYTIERK